MSKNKEDKSRKDYGHEANKMVTITNQDGKESEESEIQEGHNPEKMADVLENPSDRNKDKKTRVKSDKQKKNQSDK